MKICKDCGLKKENIDFNICMKNTDKLQSICTNCERDNATLRLYGIKISEELVKQNNKCACCGDLLDLDKKYSVHTDHDPKTGEFCGVVCRNCNLLIGYALEDTTRLLKGFQYLSHYKTENKLKIYQAG